MRRREIADQIKRFAENNLSTNARLIYLSLTVNDASGDVINYATLTEWTGIKSADTLKRCAVELEQAGFVETKLSRHGVVYTIL
ncbi:hypothetical protein XO47_15195 [Listeria monocytogenes]|nr:hypothetical protein [Listeria monocytogenes]